MKKKIIKKIVQKTSTILKIRLYLAFAIVLTSLVATIIFQHYKYEKLRSEIWDKIEEVTTPTNILY